MRELKVLEQIQFIQNHSFNSSKRKWVDGSYELRHKVFNDRLSWKVVSDGEREVDVFDNPKTWYAILKNDNDQVIGTWRALPTTGDYMLRNVFPQMTRGETMPDNPDIWEISRFAIDKTKRTIPQGRKFICDESKALIQSFYDFSYQRDIKQLVAVTSVAAERMMKNLNVNLRRLGDGKAVRIGSVLTTAVLIDIPQHPEQHLSNAQDGSNVGLHMLHPKPTVPASVQL